MTSAPETYRVAAAVRPRSNGSQGRGFGWYAFRVVSIAFCCLCALYVIRLWSIDGERDDAVAKLPSAQSRLDDYQFRLDVLGLTPLVEHYKVSGTTVTVAVANEWHYQPYQIRLQAAQKLWRIWADVNIPLAPEDAPILITDASGNEVGGFGALSGIWVQE